MLHRAKPEILRGVELLIDKMQNEMADLLVEVNIPLLLFVGYVTVVLSVAISNIIVNLHFV